MIEVLKKMYQLLLTEPHAPTVCNQLEVILRQAIAELESQEPVAWMDADGNVSDNNDHKCFPIPLYTYPPQRTWVGLSKDEVDSWELPDTPTVAEFAWFIEAKLKEKNT